MIRFRCPQCSQPLQHPTAHDKVSCPKCGRHVRVPTPPMPSLPHKPPPNRAPTILGQYSGDDQATGSEPTVPELPIAVTAMEVIALAPAPVPVADEVEVVRPRRRSLRINPLRFVSPTFLMFAMAMLPLPFVEIRCNATMQTVASQSPVQAIYGGFSTNALLENMAKDKLLETTKSVTDFDPAAGQFISKRIPKTPEEIEKWRKQQLRVRPSPFMAAFCLCLIMGFLVGMATPWRFARAPTVACFSGSAVVLLFVQKTLGFPLDQAIAEQLMSPENHDMLMGLGALIYESRPTPWFWCCLVSCILAALSAVAEVLVGVSNAMSAVLGGD
jgi:hypothetical protein